MKNMIITMINYGLIAILEAILSAFISSKFTCIYEISIHQNRLGYIIIIKRIIENQNYFDCNYIEKLCEST